MSTKGGRKNLGTVVELAETGEDCVTSPLIANPDAPSTENNADIQNSQNIVIEIPSDDVTKESEFHHPEAEHKSYKYPKDIEELYEQVCHYFICTDLFTFTRGFVSMGFFVKHFKFSLNHILTIVHFSDTDIHFHHLDVARFSPDLD